MKSQNSGHEKLIKVIMNKKVVLKLNYQELEELNFALKDRLESMPGKSTNCGYLKFIKRTLRKIEKKTSML